MHSQHRFNIVLLATFLALAQPSSNAHALGAGPTYPKGGCNVTAQVLNANDGGSGSLRAAITDLCPEGTITFASRFVIRLQSEIVIAKALTLDGSSQSLNASSGDANLVQILGGASHRIFRVDASGQLSIKRLRLSDGRAVGTELAAFGGAIHNKGRLELRDCKLDRNATNTSGPLGGAIFNDNGASLLVEGCTFTGNDAMRGSAIFNAGTAELINSTFSENRGTTNEGAIHNRGTLTAIHITVANNGRLVERPSAGGLFAFGESARTTLINSIIADNRGNDCFVASGTLDTVALLAEVRDGCTAQLTIDPALGALSANGGVTTTQAPAAASPAVDAADPEFCVATDQRGFLRLRVSACDLGALELEGVEVVFSDGFEAP
jgi:hypothetical protein